MTFDKDFGVAANPGPGRRIPGAVLIAANRIGNIVYLNAQGFTSVDESLAKPIRADTTFWVASCTKLVTTVAALQCVEKGLLSLDDEHQLSTILPEYASPSVLAGFDSLLTHSSGMGYDFMSPALMRWRSWDKENSQPRGEGVTAQCFQPLLFEPGEGWECGVSLDWVGVMIERINGGLRLGEYMKQNIWDPLGMDSTTMHLGSRPDIQQRLCGASVRSASGELEPTPPHPLKDSKDDRGGGGMCISPNDYIKILVALLKNDGALLKPETVRSMFEPQLRDRRYLNSFLDHPLGGPMCRAGVESDAWNFGLGGILNLENVDGVCKKGTMSWSGLPNLYWWIDPQSGLCGMYAS
ncbi:beta-lactamase [Cladophialophora psammophila CBS 110553]|uniref:Beta-lactamase n=1 Tax=Cladophialophora psammophila CBS 110553 TaxID=1182543 RepID=W9XJB4_9EURO|nr:beta-lactamase [Cladophialophora psammophila CBS 110553]EXJ70444.1 beta-lactamase [Cladophialophora psammophila CBS 110553]